MVDFVTSGSRYRNDDGLSTKDGGLPTTKGATIKADQEEMRAKIMADLEEMKATQEMTEYTKDMHVLTTLQGQASDILPRDTKEVTYKETIGALEDRFWDQQLAAGCRNELKTDPRQESTLAGVFHHH
jgi:hypothetical protein